MMRRIGRHDGRRADRAPRSARWRARSPARPTWGCRWDPKGMAALLPAGVAEFGEGLSISAGRGPALPGAARGGAPPAVQPRALAAGPVCSARSRNMPAGITVDASALRDAMPQIDPANPEALREALSGRGVVPAGGHPAAKGRPLPAGDCPRAGRGLGDDGRRRGRPRTGSRRPPRSPRPIRRRRATGGPAERTFATLVGLELRPRKLRERGPPLAPADRRQRGVSGRDAVWAHPDLLPTERTSMTRMASSAGGQSWDISALDEATGDETTGAAGSDGPPGEEPPGSGERGDGPAEEPPAEPPADRTPGSGPGRCATGPPGGVIPRRPRRWVTAHARCRAKRADRRDR